MQCCSLDQPPLGLLTDPNFTSNLSNSSISERAPFDLQLYTVKKEQMNNCHSVLSHHVHLFEATTGLHRAWARKSHAGWFWNLFAHGASPQPGARKGSPTVHILAEPHLVLPSLPWFCIINRFLSTLQAATQLSMNQTGYCFLVKEKLLPMRFIAPATA